MVETTYTGWSCWSDKCTDALASIFLSCACFSRPDLWIRGQHRYLTGLLHQMWARTQIILKATIFTYDSENRLKSVNGAAVLIVYNVFGNRIAKTVNGVTTKYLVDDLNPTAFAQVVEELVNGAVQRKYTYGLQRISENQLISNTWTPSFYRYDGGGKGRQLTNS